MISVEVVIATAPNEVQSVSVHVPEEATVSDVLAQESVALVTKHLEVLSVGVFGRKVALDFVLSDGDRLEIYRPLLLNPKEARRLRAKKQAESQSKKS